MKYIKFLKMMTVSVLMTLAFLVAIPQDTCAQSAKMQKQREKAANKMYKAKMKEYKKQGWLLAGSSKTLDVALMDHYMKLAEDENNQEIVGEVTQCKSSNVCKQFAQTNALNLYASRASGNVKGRIESMLRADANMPQVEIDKFIAGYENQVKAEVGGVLTESYSIYRITDTKTKTQEFKTFFVVNEEKAMVSRQRAMERSLQETKIAVKEAQEISKFVNEGFSVE